MSAGGGTRGSRALFRAVLLGLALGGAAACSEDVEPQTSVQAFCSGVCRAVLRCGLNSNCNASCAQSSHAERYSRDGAQQLGDCLSNLACPVLTDDAAWTEAWGACWQSSKPLVPVTAHVRNVCGRFVEALFECSSLYSTAQCEADLGMWSDAVLDDVASCLAAEDCEALAACEKGVFAEP